MIKILDGQSVANKPCICYENSEVDSLLQWLTFTKCTLQTMKPLTYSPLRMPYGVPVM